MAGAIDLTFDNMGTRGFLSHEIHMMAEAHQIIQKNISSCREDIRLLSSKCDGVENDCKSYYRGLKHIINLFKTKLTEGETDIKIESYNSLDSNDDKFAEINNIDKSIKEETCSPFSEDLFKNINKKITSFTKVPPPLDSGIIYPHSSNKESAIENYKIPKKCITVTERSERKLERSSSSKPRSSDISTIHPHSSNKENSMEHYKIPKKYIERSERKRVQSSSPPCDRRSPHHKHSNLSRNRKRSISNSRNHYREDEIKRAKTTESLEKRKSDPQRHTNKSHKKYDKLRKTLPSSRERYIQKNPRRGSRDNRKSLSQPATKQRKSYERSSQSKHENLELRVIKKYDKPEDIIEIPKLLVVDQTHCIITPIKSENYKIPIKNHFTESEEINNDTLPSMQENRDVTIKDEEMVLQKESEKKINDDIIVCTDLEKIEKTEINSSAEDEHELHIDVEELNENIDQAPLNIEINDKIDQVKVEIMENDSSTDNNKSINANLTSDDNINDKEFSTDSDKSTSSNSEKTESSDSVKDEKSDNVIVSDLEKPELDITPNSNNKDMETDLINESHDNIDNIENRKYPDTPTLDAIDNLITAKKTNDDLNTKNSPDLDISLTLVNPSVENITLGNQTLNDAVINIFNTPEATENQKSRLDSINFSSDNSTDFQMIIDESRLNDSDTNDTIKPKPIDERRDSKNDAVKSPIIIVETISKCDTNKFIKIPEHKTIDTFKESARNLSPRISPKLKKVYVKERSSKRRISEPIRSESPILFGSKPDNAKMLQQENISPTKTMTIRKNIKVTFNSPKNVTQSKSKIKSRCKKDDAQNPISPIISHPKKTTLEIVVSKNKESSPEKITTETEQIKVPELNVSKTSCTNVITPITVTPKCTSTRIDNNTINVTVFRRRSRIIRK